MTSGMAALRGISTGIVHTQWYKLHTLHKVSEQPVTMGRVRHKLTNEPDAVEWVRRPTNRDSVNACPCQWVATR
jgi:hypothetical protein